MNLIDVTLACEDANSKLVEVVTVADVDAEDRVGNSLLQIWKLRFAHKQLREYRIEYRSKPEISKLFTVSKSIEYRTSNIEYRRY